jgi:hypothetical protein
LADKRLSAERVPPKSIGGREPLLTLRIPAKANAFPKGSRTAFRAEAEHHRSVATLAF